jgi:hypothetical protein
MKYEIDGETADNITKNVIGDTIKLLKKSITKTKAEIKSKGDKASAGLYEDLNTDIKYLQACNLVYEFFGGNLK